MKRENKIKSTINNLDIKEVFVSKKEKMYPLSREERGEVYEFIEKQLRK